MMEIPRPREEDTGLVIHVPRCFLNATEERGEERGWEKEEVRRRDGRQ